MTDDRRVPNDPDPRESEDWFQRLPDDAKARTRAVWRARAQQPVLGSLRERAGRRRALWEAGVLLSFPLLLANVLVLPFGRLLLLLVVGFAAGAAVGYVGHRCGAGRFMFSLAGLIAFALVHVGFAGVAMEILGLLFLFFGCYLAANLFGLYGHRLEYRELEG